MSGRLRSLTDGMNRRTFIAPTLFLMAPVFGLLYYIWVFGVSVVLFDEWNFVPFLEQALQRTLLFPALFAQYNQHRLFFPRLIMIALAELTQYNTVAEMLFGWFMVLLASLIIFRAYQREFPSLGSRKLALIFLPASLMLFSFRQSEAILFGFPSVQFYSMIFGAVSSIYLLGNRRLSMFGLAVGAAVFASFSSLQGLFIWPTGLFQLLFSRAESRIRKAIIWGIAGASVIAAYSYGLPNQSSRLSYALSDPLAASAYFFALLGAPFSYEQLTARALGILLILITALVLWQSRRAGTLRRNGIWLSLILFAGLSIFATTMGRSSISPEGALDSRYTPVTVLGIVGLYFLAVAVSRKSRAKRKNLAVRLLLLILFVGFIVSYGGGWVAGQLWKCREDMGAYVLRTYKTQSDYNIKAWLNPSNARFIRDHAAFLEQNRLNVFNGPMANATKTVSPDCETFSEFYKFFRQLINGELSGISSIPQNEAGRFLELGLLFLGLTFTFGILGIMTLRNVEYQTPDDNSNGHPCNGER